MKKALLLTGIFLLLFIFGCTQKTGIASVSEPEYKAFTTYWSTPGINDGRRMYTFRGQSDEYLTGKGLLSYLNDGSSDWQVLCWRPNCSHASEDCPAYYVGRHKILNVSLDGKVRVLEFPQNGQMLVIWEVDTRKSTKNKLASYDLKQMTDNKNTGEVGYISTWDFCEYRGILYIRYPSEYIDENGNIAGSTWMIRINLETLEAERSVCFNDAMLPKDYPVVHDFAFIEDTTVYVMLAGKRPGSESEEPAKLRLYGFDLETQTLSDTGFGTDGSEIYSLMGHQALCRKQMEDGQYCLEKMNLLTGDRSWIEIEDLNRGSMTVSAAQYLGYIDIATEGKKGFSMYQYNLDTEDRQYYSQYGSRICISYSNGYAGYYEFLEDGYSYKLVLEKVIH